MTSKCSDYRVTEIQILGGQKIRHPFADEPGVHLRTDVSLVKPLQGAKYVPVRWLDHGILVGKSSFLPYGLFTATLEAPEKRARRQKPAKEAPEAPKAAPELEG